MNELPIENPDDAALRMLGGAQFSPDGKLVLPSGRVLIGPEAQAACAVFSCARLHPHSPVAEYGEIDPTNPLSSANDHWTGDPAVDRAALVARALQALLPKAPPVPDWNQPTHTIWSRIQHWFLAPLTNSKTVYVRRKTKERTS